MKKKLNKNGGFTLVEMLIVVAIIAILIAVSIPLVSGALEKARDATDQANERAAKAEAVLVYMGVDENNQDKQGKEGGYIYDAVNGKLLANGTSTEIAKYGKCTGGENHVTTDYTNKGDHTSSIIGVWISAKGEVTVGWVAEKTKTVTLDGTTVKAGS